MQRRDVLKAAIATAGLASAAGRTAEARRAAQGAAAGNPDTIHVHPARGVDGNGELGSSRSGPWRKPSGG